MENKTPEEILKLHFSCTCDEIYKSRNITDPNCFICENESELMQIMQEYGKQQYNQGVLDSSNNVDRIALDHTSICFIKGCILKLLKQ